MSIPSQPAFDYARLEQELGKDSTQTLAQMFLDDTRDVLTNLNELVEQNDADRLRKLVHMLKGGCRSIIALSSERFCENLEESAAQANCRR